MLAAGALLVLRIVPHSARSQTLQARSFLGTLGPLLCTPHSDLKLGNFTKNLITATAGIGRVYKLQQCFIILLGVYCETFFWVHLGEHPFLGV